MARINLLPWREAHRAELRRRFLAALAAAGASGVLLAFIASWLLGAALRDQHGRNAYLKEHIAGLNQQVEEIQTLERKREQLHERMEVIQSLQGNRPIIVRVFDQLARAAPEGVVYTELHSADGLIRIAGIAESNRQVSGLMRQLEVSDWFHEPALESVRAEPRFGAQAAAFNMTAHLGLPKAAGEAP